MIVFPAIDLFAGQAVRLRQGDYAAQTHYGDPLAIALRYVEAGATHVHVVDLDAAKTGTAHPSTREIVTKIVQETPLKVELGGGIRKLEDVETWLRVGVWRCVLGTAAAKNPEFAKLARDAFGDRVIVGIDARASFVATVGWTETEGLLATDFARILNQFGYSECIHTDIAKDGMLTGANVEASAELARHSGLKVVVSGGVRDVQDVLRVSARAQEGLSGMIAGKSLFEGTLDLREAIAVARRERGSEE